MLAGAAFRSKMGASSWPQHVEAMLFLLENAGRDSISRPQEGLIMASTCLRLCCQSLENISTAGKLEPQHGLISVRNASRAKKLERQRSLIRVRNASRASKLELQRGLIRVRNAVRASKLEPQRGLIRVRNVSRSSCSEVLNFASF